MKKVLLLWLFATSSLVTVAQSGNWYIGGVGGFGSSTNESASGFKTTNSSWAFGPEVGTFINDNIQLGLYLGVSGSSQKNDNGDIQSSTSISPTIYGRKFFKITDNFSTFAGLYLNISSGTTKDYTGTPTSESTQSGFGVRLGVGIAYALSPRFTAVGQYGLMGYQSSSSKVDGIDAGSNSGFDFGVNTIGSSTLSQGNGSGSVFNIGLYYTLKQNN